MLTSVEGIWRQGHVVIAERPQGVQEEAQVIVTFLAPSDDMDLAAHGLTSEQAADLRARLAAFDQDWSAPEMDVYDDYDAAKSRLATGP